MSTTHPLEGEAWRIASDLQREGHLSLSQLMLELQKHGVPLVYAEFTYIAGNLI